MKISEIKVLVNWEIYMGGSRQGANVSIEDTESGAMDDRRRILGTVKGWLDADREPCARRNATYCLIKRWSYGLDTMDIPEWFAVAIARPPKYQSKTFRPAE